MNYIEIHDPMVFSLNPTTCRKCGMYVQYNKSAGKYASVNGVLCGGNK
jgi:hypothetical protein